MKQLLLPIELIQTEDSEIILSDSNQEAFLFVSSAEKWIPKMLLILGEAGSGKSKLVSFWRSKYSALKISSYIELIEMDYSQHKFFYIEDIEHHLEEDLFHIMNICIQNELYLLMTARSISFSLKDLKSRIDAINKVRIKMPDESLMVQIMQKIFKSKQIEVDINVLKYVSYRMNRSYSALLEFIDRIDKLSLEERRKITINLVKEL